MVVMVVVEEENMMKAMTLLEAMTMMTLNEKPAETTFFFFLLFISRFYGVCCSNKTAFPCVVLVMRPSSRSFKCTTVNLVSELSPRSLHR